MGRRGTRMVVGVAEAAMVDEEVGSVVVEADSGAEDIGEVEEVGMEADGESRLLEFKQGVLRGDTPDTIYNCLLCIGVVCLTALSRRPRLPSFLHRLTWLGIWEPPLVAAVPLWSGDVKCPLLIFGWLLAEGQGNLSLCLAPQAS